MKGVVQQAADHPPLYVLYLAMFSLVGLRGDLTHMLVSAPLGAMSALTFALLGRKVWSPRAGIVAGLIGAFTPSLIHYPGFLLSETLTVPLLAAFALFLYRLVERPTWGNAAWAGTWCGLAVLTHPDASLLVPLAIVPVIALRREVPWLRRFGLLVAAGITCGGLVLPWVAFNLHRYDKPVYLSIGLDYSMAQGTCDITYYGDLIGSYSLACMSARRLDAHLDLADQSVGAAQLRKATLDYIGSHKGRTAIVVAARVGREIGVFRPLQEAALENEQEGREPWLANISILSFYPLAAAAIVGGLLLHRRSTMILPMVVLAFEGVIGAALTLAVLRYRVTAEIPLAVLTGVTVDVLLGWIWRAWHDDETRPLAVEAAGVR